jgi:peptidoglycan hydrolase-like protein with peptidoglycan-binding domain
MTNIISISKLSNSVIAGATLALVLAVSLMTGFQYASAAEVNILAGQNLSVGSTGQDVVVLQGILSEMGYLQVPAGVALGYYGALTRAAVGRYQTAQGVAPTAGYFGPFTKIAMHQQFFTNNWLTMMGW